MHNYLRAIGFSKLKNKSDQNKLISAALNDSKEKKEIEIGSNTKLVQINRNYGNGIGLSIVGEYDKEGLFNIDHSFPYCTGMYTSSQSDIQIEGHVDKEAYSVVADDFNPGITIIFHLQNIIDYVKTTWSNDFFRVPDKVKFGALSINGRILFGVHLEHVILPYEKHPISDKERRRLVTKAKQGEEGAYEDLTMYDMNAYTLMRKRMKDEDVLTIVETYFMPYGINNELYSILGIITDIQKITNDFSDEIVYNLSVFCNDIKLNVAINSYDLQGEPAIGRRFKGIIWLQGQIDFSAR